MKIIKGNFPQKNTAGEDADYSAMLMDLVNPYLDPVPEAGDLENSLQLGITAWNMAVAEAMEFPAFEQMFETTLKGGGVSGSDVEIIKQIMKEKQKKYSGYSDLIESFELQPDEQGLFQVTVANRPFADFTNDVLPLEEDIEELQYNEGYINRNAILIKPRPAFWEWIKSKDKSFVAPDWEVEHNIYLIPEKDSDKEAIQWLKKNFETVFVNELSDWINDPDQWPPKRTYKIFNELFAATFHSMILDLVHEPVIKE